MACANAYDKPDANATVWPGKKWEYANMVELSHDNNFYTQVDERWVLVLRSDRQHGPDAGPYA